MNKNFVREVLSNTLPVFCTRILLQSPKKYAITAKLSMAKVFSATVKTANFGITVIFAVMILTLLPVLVLVLALNFVKNVGVKKPGSFVPHTYLLPVIKFHMLLMYATPVLRRKTVNLIISFTMLLMRKNNMRRLWFLPAKALI